MYCSIREAWGDDFGSVAPNQNQVSQITESRDKKVKRKRTLKKPITTKFIKEEDNEEEYIPEEIVKDNRYNYMRNVNRLENHNGSDNREILVESNNNNDYIQPREEQLETAKYIEDEYVGNDEILLDNNTNQDYNRSEESHLVETHHNLSFIIDKINILMEKIDKRNMTNNIDVFLFILVGIFIIFILDSILKFGRYLRCN